MKLLLSMLFIITIWNPYGIYSSTISFHCAFGLRASSYGGFNGSPLGMTPQRTWKAMWFYWQVIIEKVAVKVELMKRGLRNSSFIAFLKVFLSSNYASSWDIFRIDIYPKDSSSILTT
ncbi:Uncharacterized protein TCM_018546 [Theobroma cacao]|uniref:Uncharacterized protein n=1 Tax=Theobroma cacao TaxID=3641 RepID=A0A061EFL9_THECC|nr:Uncharacterized protein TCM_018546 [Theobroma cacao]